MVELADHLRFVKDVHGLAVHAHRNGVSVGKVDFDHPGAGSSGHGFMHALAWAAA